MAWQAGDELRQAQTAVLRSLHVLGAHCEQRLHRALYIYLYYHVFVSVTEN